MHKLARAFGLDRVHRRVDPLGNHRLTQDWHEVIRGDERVAERDVDPLATNRRHRVRGVADHECARHPPARDAVRDGREEKRMGELAAMRAQVGTEVWRHVVGHVLHPLLDAAPSQFPVGPFGDHPGHLEQIVGDAVGDQQVRAADIHAYRHVCAERIR